MVVGTQVYELLRVHISKILESELELAPDLQHLGKASGHPNKCLPTFFSSEGGFTGGRTLV